MGNIKIHEIAKELNLNSKEVLKKAEELGITVKSHLSAVDEETANRIRNSFKKNTEKKESKSKKENKKPQQAEHVIIRREVIINDEEGKKQEQPKQNNKNMGFGEQNRKKDYNIVYRNKQTRPMTVNELFGIAPKKEEKKEIKKETKIEEVKKEIEKRPEEH